MGKKFKVFLIVLCALLSCVAIGVDVWWAVVYFKADTVVESKTINVDLQTLTDGTSAPFISVQLFKNSNCNGLSAFEVRFNNVTDETRTAFYSKGSQFIGDDYSCYNFDYFADGFYRAPNVSNHFSDISSYSNYLIEMARAQQDMLVYRVDSQHYGLYHERQYTYNFYSQKFKGDLEQYNYMSGNDYYDSMLDSTGINDDTFFKLVLTDSENDTKIIGMQFKGMNWFRYNDTGWAENEQLITNPVITKSRLNFTNANEEDYVYNLNRSCISDSWFFGARETLDFVNSYYLYDYNYLLTYLYTASSSLPAGTQHCLPVRFGDWFFFYELDENLDYRIINGSDSNSKISHMVNSYISVEFIIHEDGLTNANQSLFNSVRGSSTFSLNSDIYSDDYFIGKTIVNVDYTSFIFVNIYDDKYALKLKNSFVDFYGKYKDFITLSINIDTDYLLSNNIDIVGFTSDSGLSNFIIHDSNIEIGGGNL